MSKPFASSADLSEKNILFYPLSDGVYAFTAEGDPNTGVVIGDKSILVFDSQATPLLAGKVLKAIRDISSLPIHYVVLSHYHAVRALGASAFSEARVIASHATDELISERGQQDWESELRRFPRLFDGAEAIPALTQPDIILGESLSIDLGGRRVELIHPGAGHTGGDTVAWLPEEKILFAGDLVESEATPYCGDAYLEQWPETLSRLVELEPEKLLPGRGRALMNSSDEQAAIESTRGYVTKLFNYASEAVSAGKDLKDTFDHIRTRMDSDYSQWVIYEHCLPFNVSRAFDEASGLTHPQIWTAERDQAMWQTLQG